jgi:glycosyltransferase involved in cell wall biosynthesis
LQIGIIHPFFDVMGGAEQTTLSLIEKLKTTQNITTLYTVEPPKISEALNFKFHLIKKKNFPTLWRYQRMKEVKKLFSESQKNDIVIVMGGSLLLEKSNVGKMIVYCHSTFTEEDDFSKARFRGVKGIYYRIIQNNVKNSISCMNEKNVRLITNSEYTREEIRKRFGKDSSVVYPPVNISKFLKFFDSIKQKNVITISRYSPEKKLDDAIDIVKSSSLPYVLIGNAKYRSQLELFEKLKRKTSQSNIELGCNLPYSEIEKVLVSSKVYFHTSKETFGISVVEAISAGCIPVVPNNSAHKETVPFEELRYNGKDDAMRKLQDAMSGKYDNLRNDLKNHIQKFSAESFQEKMLREIVINN